MSSIFGCYQSHSDKVHCPRCGQEGSVVWEALPFPEGELKSFIKIEGDFYERLAKRPPYPIELVCNSCGTAQTSALQA